MKKITIVLISVLLCVSALVGCGANGLQPAAPAAPAESAPAETPAEPTEEPTPAEEADGQGEASAPDAALLGGWTAAESFEISAEVESLFDRAMEGLVGVDYEPLAYLAGQPVAGTNHAILCSARVVRPDARPYYAVVYLYEDLQGSAELTDIKAMTPDGHFDENAASAAPLAGGWSVPEAEEDGMAAFEKAAETLLGVDYTPVKVMGEQTVAGRNYCVLCRAKAVHPDAAPYYCFVYVYQQLDGQAEVTEVFDLEL